jgi:hypothetical protein
MQVHEARFGGAWVAPSKTQLRLKQQRENMNNAAATPTTTATKGARKKGGVDWRSSCLRCEHTRTQFVCLFSDCDRVKALLRAFLISRARALDTRHIHDVGCGARVT